jgi:hypothetical protein
MKRYVSLISLLVALLTCGSSFGLEVKGVTLPDTATADGKAISLVGAGVRTKYFLKIKIYVAGLYMEQPSKDENQIIESDQGKRMVMHFLYKEVNREKLVNGWNEGFAKNSRDMLPALQTRIDQFNAFFDSSVKKGEEVVLTYVPEKGTEVAIKGEVKGVIEGKDFMEALFKIWFGKYPADAGLKKSILK